MDSDSETENPWVEEAQAVDSVQDEPNTNELMPPFEGDKGNKPTAVESPLLEPSRAQRPREPTSPSRKMSDLHGSAKDLIFGVCIVNFHHLRGPEVEYSKLAHEDFTKDVADLWPYLPFQALPDGAHAFDETFAYFTLRFPLADDKESTLFGISCAMRINSQDLLEKDSDVTRSSVQKAIVVILRQPVYGQIKEKLSIVTRAFFEQKNFNDRSIVDVLYQNLRDIYNSDATSVDESEFYSGISLRGLVRDFNKDVLVILKAMLLEKRVAFYSSNPTTLCVTEFAFISLIPNLINNLLDSSSPELDNYSKTLTTQTSFQMSDRNSVLSFAGLPLQIFGKGGLFSPYCPLQQFDDLRKTPHYVIGTSNALLLNQKAQMCDVLVNLDTRTVEIVDQTLVQPLHPPYYDRKWMSHVAQAVAKSWSDNYSAFLGSDDYIRWQFEDYLTSMLSTVKFANYLDRFNGTLPSSDLTAREYDSHQLKNFNLDFINLWKSTENYKLFNTHTDDHIFDIFEPKHVYSEEVKTLSEKFQIFKNENTKRFEEYKKSFKTATSKEHQEHNENESSTEKNVNDKKKNQPTTTKGIWSWYTGKKTNE
ncbi:unnamed protein product [Cyberlindnera jadinii]|uniref:UDENN domain-containing protein n=1 Tax=Cyberlindnera jadinii (strain ATCC 18201 / CBS 1600 / BCRC 20928 / JCM 3617 / NBRC 0987 / NRRL Y-1542) TaxID=983966 RepID=A0A0H5C6N1_CYBJN|nr:unnamed protein product [Cyberlindnera jadinii]